jgi:phosphate transport system substrate-binding protein
MRIFNLFLLLVVLASCGTNPDQPYSDTPTSGKVNAAADESLVPLAGAQLDTFHSLYRYAKINMVYKPEDDIFRMLVDDSVKVIMATRKLNDKENAYFKSRNLIPVTTKVAFDAVAVIVNRSNPDSLFSIDQIKKILNGEYSTWKQLNSATPLKNIAFVFDQNGSSTYRYLKEYFNITHPLPEWCFAAKSNKDVISYVEEHENAIGVIGVSWISDEDDSDVRGFLSRIKVAGIAADEHAAVNDYYKPYQGYIAEKTYPFIREVYMISREGRAGLGTGFVSFVAGDQGQRIVRLNGLLPATMPVRLIKTN